MFIHKETNCSPFYFGNLCYTKKNGIVHVHVFNKVIILCRRVVSAAIFENCNWIAVLGRLYAIWALYY